MVARRRQNALNQMGACLRFTSVENYFRTIVLSSQLI
jgi:hypothetical protein